jgi:glycosyltransferase involved in cell wall biosynthesis
LVNEHLVGRVIVNAKAIERTLLEGNSWLAPAKIKLIYNGFPPVAGEKTEDREILLRELSLAEAQPLMIHVGLLKERKGHDTLFHALQDMTAEFPRLALLVVGEGELRAPLEDLAKRLRLEKAVHFLGYRQDAWRFIEAADVLVLPTRNEGFPWVVAEAMSLAKPIVASKVGGLPELVEEGRTGLLVPPDDPAALKTALVDLARHPERARRLGRAGRDRIRDHFGLEKMIDQLEAFFAEVIGKGGLKQDL